MIGTAASTIVIISLESDAETLFPSKKSDDGVCTVVAASAEQGAGAHAADCDKCLHKVMSSLIGFRRVDRSSQRAAPARKLIGKMVACAAKSREATKEISSRAIER